MADAPLSRREARARQEAALAAAAQPPAAPEPVRRSRERIPYSEESELAAAALELAPPQESPPDSLASRVPDRVLTRREMRALAAGLAGETDRLTETGTTPVARNIVRRPVAEPTTSTTIPRIGALHVPLETIPTYVAPQPAEMAPETPPERSSIRGMASPAHEVPRPPVEEAEVEADEPVEDLIEAIQPTPAEAEEVLQPEWRPISREPEPEPEATLTATAAPVQTEPDADAENSSQEEESEVHEISTSRVGIVVRYVLLVVAFFIIGALFWIFINSQLMDGASAGAVILGSFPDFSDPVGAV